MKNASEQKMDIGAPSRVLTRRAFAVGAVMSLAAGGSFALKPRSGSDKLGTKRIGDLVPMAIGPWQFADSAGIVDAREDAPVDGYDQVLTRRYIAPDLPDIMLLIAYGSAQGGGLQLHRPETCYPGQGFSLSDFVQVQLQPGKGQSVAGRAFTATRDDRIERLAYWTRVADSFPGNTMQEYRAIFASLLAGTVPDGVLVRVSTITSDPAGADQALQRFQTLLIRDAVAARALLLGNTMASVLA